MGLHGLLRLQVCAPGARAGAADGGGWVRPWRRQAAIAIHRQRNVSCLGSFIPRYAMQQVHPYNIFVSVAYPPDTDTPGFKVEELTKPTETTMICGVGNVFPAERVRLCQCSVSPLPCTQH